MIRPPFPVICLTRSKIEGKSIASEYEYESTITTYLAEVNKRKDPKTLEPQIEHSEKNASQVALW